LQEAFTCLSVFVSEVFDAEQAAVNIIGGDEGRAKQNFVEAQEKIFG
jgi:hypothetical protein